MKFDSKGNYMQKIQALLSFKLNSFVQITDDISMLNSINPSNL